MSELWPRCPLPCTPPSCPPIVCGRCMGMLPREPHFPSADGVTASNSPEVLHSLDRSRGEGRPGSEAYDAWGMEQQLHHLSRRIRGGGPRRTQRTTPNASPGAPMPASKPALRRTTWATYPEWNWGVLAFGMMASLCGLALSGWSIFTREPELWNVGFPILAGGASGVFVGVLVQLDRLGRQSSE